MQIITTDRARQHCRADSDDDSMLSVYAGAAEQAAQDFLNRRVYATGDDLAAAVLAGSAGEDPIVVNDAILAAMLLILGHLYKNREEVMTGQGSAAVKIPVGAEFLLWPHRIGLGV